MPSNSRALFRDKLLPDVANLEEAHASLSPNGRGRRGLGYITRSGVVILCASLELYFEEVIVESAEFLVKSADSPDFLPLSIKRRICNTVKGDKDELGALRLCGMGWKEVYLESVRKEVERLNSPKYERINAITSGWLDLTDISSGWRHSRDTLNEFVALRGEVAHRGADARYVRVQDLRELKSIVDDIVVDTDRMLCDHLAVLSSNNRRPWRR